MSNPGQPTIQRGDHGAAVRRAQRAIRRTPDTGLTVDGDFGPATEQAVRDFQEIRGLAVDGVVGPHTWAALPDGGPMPVLREGSTGHVVRRLQTVLNDGAGEWGEGAGAVDGHFGPATRRGVLALQRWGGVTADGVVGEQTWDLSLHAMSATLETTVGLEFVEG